MNLNSIELTAYPNPFGKQTTVRFTLPYQEDKATLNIYSLKGVKIQTLFTSNAIPNYLRSTINGLNLFAGTYFFKLITTKEMKNFKVIMGE